MNTYKTVTINFTKIGKILWACVAGLFILLRIFVMLMLTGIGFIFISFKFQNENWLWVVFLIILCANFSDWFIGVTNFWKKYG